MTANKITVSTIERQEMRCAIFFPSEEVANLPVAGIPAAARVLRAIKLQAFPQEIAIIVPGGWQPTNSCKNAWRRLAEGTPVWAADAGGLDTSTESIADGVKLLEGRSWDASVSLELRSKEGVDARDRLLSVSRTIIASTAKPTDGVVSRYFNRKISQAISHLLLRAFPSIRPVQATFAVAVCAIIMLWFLIDGGVQGLSVGAILFQAASVLDGVDGEIARAKFLTSKSGATMDSITDAIANLGFIFGLSWNFYIRGDFLSAGAGAVGLCLLGVGLLILGRLAFKREGRVHFDALKSQFSGSPSAIRNALSKVFMRDFYALVLTVAVLLGFASQALFVFVAAVVSWLAAVLILRARIS